MHKSKHHKNASFSYKEALSKILATGPYLLISCLFLAITSPVNGQENPCGETMVKLPYEISRTSPVNGGSLPADEPVLIEMIAPSMVLDAPEQQIEPITYKELYVGPLPFGVVHSLQTLRSDYGTTRYLGGDTLHWEPTSWDAPMERRVLVIIRLMELLDDGTVAPASFVEGSSYTVAMKIADINGEPGTYIDYEFSFTAEAPKGALALDTVSSELTVNLQESCETTDLDCESDPDTCDIQCANAAELARIGVETTFSPLSMENDRSLAFRASLSTHSYSWVSVLFPGEQNDAWTASLATFHGGGSIPDEACASVSMGSPGLPPVAEFETCA